MGTPLDHRRDWVNAYRNAQRNVRLAVNEALLFGWGGEEKVGDDEVMLWHGSSELPRDMRTAKRDDSNGTCTGPRRGDVRVERKDVRQYFLSILLLCQFVTLTWRDMSTLHLDSLVTSCCACW